MPLIQRLSSGSWLFDELMPPFLDKINGSARLSFLNGRRIPAYAATLAYYRVFSEPEVLSALECGAFTGRTPFRPETRPIWSRLALTVKADSSPADLDPSQSAVLSNSWKKLKELDASTGDQFEKIIQAMVALEDSGFGAASTPHLFGCLFVTRQWLGQPFEKRMTSLVHELAHQELFVINLVDRLVNSSCDYALAHAPLQGKARPPIGRLHAAHALFRMRDFQKRVGWEHAENDRLLAETCGTFKAGELTPFADELVGKVYAS